MENYNAITGLMSVIAFSWFTSNFEAIQKISESDLTGWFGKKITFVAEILSCPKCSAFWAGITFFSTGITLPDPIFWAIVAAAISKTLDEWNV